MDTSVSIGATFIMLLSMSLQLAHGSVVTKTLIRPGQKTFYGYLKKIRMRIYNNLGNNYTLSLHCKSKDNDLGEHEVNNGHSYAWKFRNNFWGRTLFFCGMDWAKNSGVFDIYVENRDASRCRDCIWRVTEDGVRGYNKEGGVEQIWFRWLPKPPAQDPH
ncbi:plant self-incompatibility protein S1 family [Striga asiatica]|uniref:S-protein homolog n=1 Tax=Striga asiatica TaxID=4170 RepID=A0A5A7QXF0_STRAF|nr:plant self-incompatibility protein S1 family [Striga asiatica]